MTETFVLLSAGAGRRYGGLKQLDTLGPNGERIFEYAIHDAFKAGFKRVVFIIRKDFEEEFKRAVESCIPKEIEVNYAYQTMDFPDDERFAGVKRTKPLGTVNALLSAKEVIGSNPFVVLNADDYYGTSVFKTGFKFISNPERKENEYAMMGFSMAGTLSKNGGVSRGICKSDSNNLLEMIEEAHGIVREKTGKIIVKGKDGKGTKEISDSSLCSMNMWYFDGRTVFNFLQEEFNSFLNKIAGTSEAETAELVIASAIGNMIQNKKCTVKVLPTSEKWFGVTFPQDREETKQKFLELEKRGVYKHKIWSDC